MVATTEAAASPAVGAYSGFADSLTRAPYVTDLTQSSAYINWATRSKTVGSLQIAPMSGGTCPGSVITWSSSALPASTDIPYRASGSSSTTTSWSFTVTNGAGTSITEYQNSVEVKGLTAGTPYCYAVFSTDTDKAVDLLPPSTVASLDSQPVQSFTTLLSSGASSTAPVTFDVLDDTGENYACTTATNCSTDVPFNSSGPPVNPDEASLYDQIGKSDAQFLVDAGDTGYNDGSQTNLGDLEDTGTTTDVSNFFGPSYYPLTGGIPTYVASGDHNQNNTALKVFPTPTNAADSGGTYAFDSATKVDGIDTTAPADWYAFSTGNVRIYVIDAAWGESATSGKLGDTTGSLCGAAGSSAAEACQPYQADNLEHWQTDSAEYQWLQSDLANPAYAGMVKFAVFHFPLQSDNPTQPSDLYAQNSSANPDASTSLEAMLSKYGVEMAFNGHAHTYQRFDPDRPGRIINYVTGGGGGVLEPVSGPTTTQCKDLLAENASVYAIGWSPTKDSGSSCGTAATPTSAAQVYNFLNVTVSGNTITVSPTDAAGHTFDVQTYTDAGSTSSSPAPPSSGSAGPPTPPSTGSAGAPSNACMTHLPAGSVVASAALSDGSGYDEVDAAGDVAVFGSAVCAGALTDTHLNQPIVGMTADPATGGYWLVASDGGVFSFDAPFLGSMGGTHLNQPIVGMTADPATGGYWLVASDGGVFSFDAPFLGSMGGTHLNQPIVGMTADPATGGYWLVASDGGVFSFDAPFLGSMGGTHLNQPIVGMTADPATGGYWLVASDGGVFSFDAPFLGSMGGTHLNQPIVGMSADPATGGYWLVASDGGVFSFNAPFWGSAA